MADRKGFLLRVDEQTLEALRRWADDEMRSLNGHIEWVLKRALKEAGRSAVQRVDSPAVEEGG